MERFLFRVQYAYPDAPNSYELVCVRAADDDVTAARDEAMTATERFTTATKATRTLTLLLVTADA